MDEEREFYTVRRAVETEIFVKKSRFIGYCRAVKDEAEAVSFIEDIKSKNRDATHNVFAYRISRLLERCSDDGEPAGSGGVPALEVLKLHELEQVAVVVTRYFGGILLGRGGLIRAYSGAAKAAVEQAGIVRKVPARELTISLDYHHYGRVRHEIEQLGYKVADTAFTDTVAIKVLIPTGNLAPFSEKVADITAGDAAVHVGDLVYLDVANGGLPEG